VQHFIEHTSEPHVSYPTETPVSAAATYSPAPTFTSEAATAHAPAPSVTAEAPAVEPKYTHVDSPTHSNTNTGTHHEHDHKLDDHHDTHAESPIVEAVPTPAPVFVPTPVAATPAPTPAPVSATVSTPVTPAASQQSLDEVLKSAGLTMAVTNPDKLRQVQEASTVSAPPTRTPRERKPVASAPSEPLVQIETQR
jgi:ribonuclease E